MEIRNIDLKYGMGQWPSSPVSGSWAQILDREPRLWPLGGMDGWMDECKNSPPGLVSTYFKTKKIDVKRGNADHKKKTGDRPTEEWTAAHTLHPLIDMRGRI